MPRENGFKNKRVVIVGGSSGIGFAVAEEAASQGAEVVIVSSKAERVQESIQSIGGDAQGQAVDVSDEKAVKSFFTNLGAFDHLVFTAGDSLQLHELADTDLKRRDARLNCVIGLRLPRSSMEVHRFERVALSSSRRESLAGARTVDGSLLQASAELSKL
jgi:NAD(P)-dependent dehydrogenase (short-subunit alcohol dehydrogenase family)